MKHVEEEIGVCMCSSGGRKWHGRCVMICFYTVAEEGFNGLPTFSKELSKLLVFSSMRELGTVSFRDSASASAPQCYPSRYVVGVCCCVVSVYCEIWMYSVKDRNVDEVK